MGATISLSEKHNPFNRAFMSLQRSPIGLAGRDGALRALGDVKNLESDLFGFAYSVTL